MSDDDRELDFEDTLRVLHGLVGENVQVVLMPGRFIATNMIGRLARGDRFSTKEDADEDDRDSVTFELEVPDPDDHRGVGEFVVLRDEFQYSRHRGDQVSMHFESSVGTYMLVVTRRDEGLWLCDLSRCGASGAPTRLRLVPGSPLSSLD